MPTGEMKWAWGRQGTLWTPKDQADVKALGELEIIIIHGGAMGFPQPVGG